MKGRIYAPRTPPAQGEFCNPGGASRANDHSDPHGDGQDQRHDALQKLE